MEPKFQSSFIPKASISSATNAFKVSSGVNISSIVANVFLIVTLLASGSIFGYKYLLTNQIKKVDKQINEARSDLKIEDIQKIVESSFRISISKGLLEKHILSSKLIDLMEFLTIKTIRFTGLTYKNDTGSSIAINVEAQTYNALAKQEGIFSQNEFIKNPKFSDFKLTTNGTVTANFSSDISSDLVSYRKAIEALSINQ
ncbi:MAG: hypothetical protein WAX85_01225 [Minisyncoccia bacterium]